MDSRLINMEDCLVNETYARDDIRDNAELHRRRLACLTNYY